MNKIIWSIVITIFLGLGIYLVYMSSSINSPETSQEQVSNNQLSVSEEEKYEQDADDLSEDENTTVDYDYLNEGEDLIDSVSPSPDARINAKLPIDITGKAKNVFNEGEFDIYVTYLKDDQKQIFLQTFATCAIDGNGCDWTSNNKIDFRATIDLSTAPVCNVSLEFFERDEKTPPTQPFYVLPLWLYGNGSCE